MSARAWQARKSGPYHLTAKQKREIVARREEQREMRKAMARVNNRLRRTAEAFRSLSEAAQEVNRAIDGMCPR